MWGVVGARAMIKILKHCDFLSKLPKRMKFVYKTLQFVGKIAKIKNHAHCCFLDFWQGQSLRL